MLQGLFWNCSLLNVFFYLTMRTQGILKCKISDSISRKVEYMVFKCRGIANYRLFPHFYNTDKLYYSFLSCPYILDMVLFYSCPIQISCIFCPSLTSALTPPHPHFLIFFKICPFSLCIADIVSPFCTASQKQVRHWSDKLPQKTIISLWSELLTYTLKSEAIALISEDQTGLSASKGNTV